MDPDPVIFHAFADTHPLLPAEQAVGNILAAIDMLALGVIAGTPILDTRDMTNPDPLHRVVAMASPAGLWKVRPPYAALAVVREEILSVRAVSYTNPLEVDAVGKVTKERARAIVAFLNYFSIAKRTQAERAASRDQENVAQYVDDQTVEITLEEKELLVERLRIENAIQREKLEALRLKNRRRRVELAERICVAQTRASDAGYAVPRWSIPEATAVADNMRLLASVDLADRMDLAARIEDT